MSNNNTNTNKEESNLNPQRTSPRFSNNNVAPHFYNQNSLAECSSNKSNHVSPTRAKKLNSSSRNLGSFEEQQESSEFSLNSSNMQLYLQKLDLLYQNLEGRVQKLETFVSDQFLITTSNPPYTIVARNSQINNSGAGFDINDFSIASNSTNSSTSTLIPAGTSNLPNSSSSSTISSFIEPVQKEISKSDLDDYCLPVLQKRATPSIGELNAIVMNLKKLKYPDYDNKFILSKVREWFRRKREYMSQRIFNICSRNFSHLANDPIAIADLCQKARNNPRFVGEIVREANLEILNELSAWEFCSEKISSYLENMLTNSSAGNLQSHNHF